MQAPRTTSEQKRASRELARLARAADEDPAAALDAAAAFLLARPRSVAETRRRLRHLGYGPAVVEVVLVRLADMGYLDDEAFARGWVESRDRARPRGSTGLQRELALKGVPRDVIDRVLGERDGSHPSPSGDPVPMDGLPSPGADRRAAERLLARRRAAIEREPDPRKRRQKAYALLARNGFDPDTSREVAALVGAAPDSEQES